MKLTKSKLKQIIKEELASLSEELTADEEGEKKELEQKLDKLQHK